MIDAATTSFFGSSFFAMLQKMARGGGSRPNYKAGVPAMASGGPVDGGSSSVGTITLNLSGNSYTLYAERKQAKEIVRTFRNMDK